MKGPMPRFSRQTLEVLGRGSCKQAGLCRPVLKHVFGLRIPRPYGQLPAPIRAISGVRISRLLSLSLPAQFEKTWQAPLLIALFCNFSRPHPGGQWLKCTPSFAIPWNPVSVEPRGASSSPQTLFGGLSVDSMARKCFEQTFIRVWVQTQVFAFLFVWNRLAIWNANGLEIKGLPEQLRGPWLFHSLSFSGLANHFVNLGASKLSPRNPCCNGFCLKLSTEYVF